MFCKRLFSKLRIEITPTLVNFTHDSNRSTRFRKVNQIFLLVKLTKTIQHCDQPPHWCFNAASFLSSPLPSIIMTISSTLLALVLMPLCLWIYSRAWINTPVVNLMPFGAIILTLCSTLIPIGLGVMLRYRYTRVADIVLKVI